jgi:hypothetical protein
MTAGEDRPPTWIELALGSDRVSIVVLLFLFPAGQWRYRPNMPHSNEKGDLAVARKFLGDFK